MRPDEYTESYRAEMGSKEIAFRKLDKSYLAWLRKNHNAPRERALAFANTLKDWAPELAKDHSSEIPESYEPPQLFSYNPFK